MNMYEYIPKTLILLKNAYAKLPAMQCPGTVFHHPSSDACTHFMHTDMN